MCDPEISEGLGGRASTVPREVCDYFERVCNCIADLETNVQNVRGAGT